MLVRITVYDVTTGYTNFAATLGGIYTNTSGQNGAWFRRGIQSSGEGVAIIAGTSSANLGERNALLTLGSANEVVEVIAHRLNAPHYTLSVGAASGGGFPARSALRSLVQWASDTNSILMGASEAYRLFLGGCRVNGSALTTTIKRVKVEYLSIATQ